MTSEPVGNWKLDAYACWVLRFAFGVLTAKPRPGYCNRGDYLVLLDWKPKYATHQDPRTFFVSDKDFWPRYLFDETQMKLQCEEWLRRHNIDPATGDFVEQPNQEMSSHANP